MIPVTTTDTGFFRNFSARTNNFRHIKRKTSPQFSRSFKIAITDLV